MIVNDALAVIQVFIKQNFDICNVEFAIVEPLYSLPS